MKYRSVWNGVSKFCLANQGNSKIVDRSYHVSGVTDRHSSSTLFERHISTEVQYCIDSLLSTSQTQTARGSGLRAGQTGKDEFLFFFRGKLDHIYEKTKRISKIPSENLDLQKLMEKTAEKAKRTSESRPIARCSRGQMMRLRP